MISKVEISSIVSLIKDFDYEMLDDAEWERFRNCDPTDEKQMLEIFNQTIVSSYETMDVQSQVLIRDGLSFILSSTGFDYKRILNMVEMPFEPIDDPRLFFSTLWYALFKSRFQSTDASYGNLGQP